MSVNTRLELTEREKFWLKCQPWLEERGYMLRPRYRPGWVASWKDKEGEFAFLRAEDGQIGSSAGFMDAGRVSDGTTVYMKKIWVKAELGSNEAEMNRLLGETSFASDPRNHCATYYEILEVPLSIEPKAVSLLVMPHLTSWHTPDFYTLGEAVEFIRQLFEGVQYLHSHHIAHNDIKPDNVMMDSRGLFDLPVHPAENTMALDWSRKIVASTRTEHPVKYYFIDFDLAKVYPPETGPHTREPFYGGDKSVPEFQREEQCDPFAVDVYRLGNLIKRCVAPGGIDGYDALYPKRRGLEFMTELINDMTHSDPKKRPTMDVAMARFETIRSKLTWRQIRSPYSKESDPPLRTLSKPWISWWIKQLSYAIRGKSAFPIP